MGDDPYDFEIAIPAGGSGGTAQKSGRDGGTNKSKSYGSRHYGGSSDEDGGSSSDVSGSGSDEEGDEESIDVKKPMPKSKPQVQLSARSGGGASAVAATSSSSSALDKAKNFLSKYSTKTVDTKASKTPPPR